MNEFFYIFLYQYYKRWAKPFLVSGSWLRMDIVGFSCVLFWVFDILQNVSFAFIIKRKSTSFLVCVFFHLSYQHLWRSQGLSNLYGPIMIQEYKEDTVIKDLEINA